MSFDWATTNLPSPSTDLNATTNTSVVRTAMDSGHVRQRQRFTGGLRPFKASWELNDAQWALFQGVFVYKLHQGADFFIMNLPFGDGFKDYLVRFTGDLSGGYKDVMEWRVSINMETENISPLTEDEVDEILGL